MPNNVRLGVSAPGAKQATGEIHNLRDAVTRLQKGGTEGFKIGAAAAITTKAFNLMGSAVGKVEDIIKDSTAAYIEDQASIQRLNSSLRANVVGQKEQIDSIEGVVKARIQLGFSDDEQRNSLAGLVAATHDVSKALEIERVAMDLARFKGISLGEASDALTKVEAGSYRILKSLGIQLGDNATQTDALAAVEKVASGQAEDYANTIAGKLTVAQTKAHEAEEKLGKGFAELEAVILPGVANAVEQFTGEIDRHQKALDYYRSQGINPTIQQIETFGHTSADVGVSVAAFTKKVDEAKGEFGGLKGRLHEARTELVAAKPPTNDLAHALHDLGYEGKTADQAIADLSSTLSNDLFGDAITAGHLAELQDTAKDLAKQASTIKDHTSPAYIELTGKIAENNQALFDLQYQMAQKEGPAAVIAFLDKAKTKWGQNNTKISNEIALLEKLYGLLNKYNDLGVISFGRYSGKIIPDGKAADGAIVKASPGGSLMQVGEGGKDEAIIPLDNGELRIPGVAANSSVMPAAAAPTISIVIQNIDASGHANPMGVGRAVKQSVHDAIADVLRQQSARLPVGAGA